MTTVRDIMSANVVTVQPDLTVRALMRVLHENEITGAPVVDRFGKLVGVVSLADVARLAATEEGGFENRTVADVMTAATFSVRPATDVRDLARLLVRTGLHRALVLDAGKLVGIVTAHDVLETVASEESEAPAGA
jgi:CBS domain-containing protein